MKATFIETTEFTKAVSGFVPSDAAYAALQQLLMEDPSAGVVMPGCGGLRKVRMADARRRKGKRGGARLIYLYVPAAKRFYMLDIYGKDEKDDLSAGEKKQLRQLAERLKREATAEHERWQRNNESWP
jgi:hypothetical protein